MEAGQHVFEFCVLDVLTPLKLLDLCRLWSSDLCFDLLLVLDLFERLLRHLYLFLFDPLSAHRQQSQWGVEAMALQDGKPDPVTDPQVALTEPLLLWLV